MTVATPKPLFFGAFQPLFAARFPRNYGPYIKEVPLFNGCSLGFIKQFATRIHDEFFLPAEVITEQGQAVDELYIVCHGELEKVGWDADIENEEFLERLQTYSSFGEVSFGFVNCAWSCNLINNRLEKSWRQWRIQDSRAKGSLLHPRGQQAAGQEVCNCSPATSTANAGMPRGQLTPLVPFCIRPCLEIHFLDGRIILNNLIEGKYLNTRNKLLESDIILYIGKHEME
ncbi:hypothetical protein L3X38_029980 [Prunus dulcis]|uniref:Cyclic nucleotide-binding domain-containing protein n=1 Tax=Prunus dulcis TaxID=3755 RepID=A0AAD4VUK4_PRUDU|nr:hypothetical protein L3X38_029980 [Prunus dulcis]